MAAHKPVPTQPPAFTNVVFVYDGDGRIVKSIINGTTTLFIGAHNEVTNGVATKYYFAGAQRIAMRKNGTLSYMLSDHLGSTSIMTNASGAMTSQMRYKAWGEVRFASGTNPTKYTYTGQYSNVSDFGLMFYNARWYDPVSGRFAQADTIVPAGVQGLDRYAYVRNSPLVYNDPSGHLEANKVKKLLGIADLTDDEFDEWLETNRGLWNELLGAKAGDMIAFMTVVNGENVYQRYIIGEDQNGDYMFWGLDNNPGEQCETTCLMPTPPSHADASRDEVLSHISSGNQWGFYSLDPESPIGEYKYNLERYSPGFTAPSGQIILPNDESWKRHGPEYLGFSREIGISGGLGLVGGVAGCIGSAAFSFGLGCAVSSVAALAIALNDSTVAGPVYYPRFDHPYGPQERNE